VIHTASIPLTTTIPLHVHLVRGSHYSAWIDSGVKAMFPQLLATMEAAGVRPRDVRFVLHTHSHHDHIGCNAQMQDATGCLIAAPAHYAAWHADFERHYQEFARPFPDLVPDTPELRDEVLSILDAPRPLDVHVDEGVTFDLGDAALQAIRLPGHMLAELGWLELRSRTLILGDAITGLDWPIFHSHLSVQGYRNSLARIERVLAAHDVQQVLFAHFPPMAPAAVTQLVAQAHDYINAIEVTIVRILSAREAATLQEIWAGTCAAMNRAREFRALNMVHAHLLDLIERGLVRETQARSYVLQ
jgi:glyoxylase-like metal-dependent hydrolase (beta-lactamase superfamily II)